MHFTGPAVDRDGGADADGDYVYSGIQAINPQISTHVPYEGSPYVFTVSPIPASDYLNIQYRLDEKENVSFTLYDLSGKTVAHLLAGSVREGLCIEHLDLEENKVSSGIYILKMVSGSMVQSKKVVIGR